MGSARIALLALVPVLACATPPPAQRAPDLSILALRVDIVGPLGPLSTKRATRVHFVRVADGTSDIDVALDEGSELLLSNYAKGNYVYLLNAPPGRYAAVAAGYEEDVQGLSAGDSVGVGGGWSVGVSVSYDPNFGYTFYLPTEIVNRTLVTLEPSSVAFLGEIVVGSTLDYDAADAVQRHYFERLAPGYAEKSLLGKALSGQGHRMAQPRELKQEHEAWQSFLEDARGDLTTQGWSRVLQHPVGAPPP